MSNKVKQKKQSRGYALLVLAIIVVGLVAGILIHHYYYSPPVTSNSSSSSKYSTTPAPATDNNQNNTRKSSSSATPTLGNNNSDNGSSANSSSFSVQINPTVTNNGANIHVGTEVFGVTSGTCSLIASQTGQSNIQLGSASVQQDVNNYDCGVFNISTSSFPTPGTWKLTLTVTNQGNPVSESENVTF